MGASEKAIQLNMKALEERGFVRRERRKTAAGDWDSNVYHLDGLVERVRALEPDFAKERAAREALREARKNAELPPHKQRWTREGVLEKIYPGRMPQKGTETVPGFPAS